MILNNPIISNESEENEILTFTINNINISLANALRRVILSNIPCIVIKSQPYSENKINIKKNTTRLNNELIKQRISSIPIFVDDIENFPYDNYTIEINKFNETTDVAYITTEDIKIKNNKLNNYLTSTESKKMFPPNNITGDYIDIVRLRSKYSEHTEGLELYATLSISNASENGTFNVVSTCSYGFTPDNLKIKENLDIYEKEIKNKENITNERIEFLKKDWMLLHSKKYYLENSFDFIIETIGIYTNSKIIDMASSIIMNKLVKTLESFKNDNTLIEEKNDNTLPNLFTLKLLNEDYTIGKILEYYFHEKYFKELESINYVGFIKNHPHDNYSIIKISFKEVLSKDDIILLIEEAVNYSNKQFLVIKQHFENF